MAAFQAWGDALLKKPLAMHEKITQILFSVVDDLNQMRPTEEHLEKSLEIPLTGDFGRLDSAGLINLIVVTEQKTGEEFGIPIMLTDDHTLSQAEHVFRTLGTLADYILQILDEKNNE